MRSLDARDLAQLPCDERAQARGTEAGQQHAQAIWSRNRDREVDDAGVAIRQHVAEPIRMTRANQGERGRPRQVCPCLCGEAARLRDHRSAGVEQRRVGASSPGSIHHPGAHGACAVDPRVLGNLLLGGLKQAVEQRRGEHCALVHARGDVALGLRLGVRQLNREHHQQRQQQQDADDQRVSPSPRSRPSPIRSDRMLLTAHPGLSAPRLEDLSEL